MNIQFDNMSKYTLLLVEDDSALSLILKEFFETSGLKVVQAMDGEEAMRLYAKVFPDIILMDIEMPKKNGFEVIEEIRSSDYTTPIILMTGARLDDASIIRGYELGAINYQKKPVYPPILLSIILSKLHPTIVIKHLKIGDKSFILENQCITMGELTINLREREALVLRTLIDNVNVPVPRKKLIYIIWGNDLPANNNMLDGIISSLRKALSLIPELEIRSIYGKSLVLKKS